MPIGSAAPRLRLRPWLELVLILMMAAAGGCAPPAEQPVTSSTTNPSAVKIVVDAEGLYEVPASALQKVGFDLASAKTQNLSLSAGGQPVPLWLVDRGSGRALWFYGQGLGASSYDGRNVYWLTMQAAPEASHPSSSAISASPARPTPGLNPVHVVSDTVRVEEQRQYLPQVDASDDRWLWQPLFAPSEIQLLIATPHATTGSGEMRLRLWGNSSAPVDPDHRLLLYLNDTPIADSAWDGLGAHVITATLPSGVLKDGDNKLMLKAPGDTGAKADSSFVDWAEISYPRELVLGDAALEFNGRGPGFTIRIPPETTSQSLVVWDITDPAQPVALTDYVVEGDRLTFASDNTLRRFLVATEAGFRQPSAITPATSPDLRDWPGGADMIVVTVPQFRRALEPLVEVRRKAGLRVAVLDVSAVYDTFDNGRAGPTAIKALVQHALAHWTPPAPRFLLLAGDASYDPRGYLKGAEADLVPTQLVDTKFTGWTASDVWYALPDNNTGTNEAAHGPLLAVGRFPVQTAEQMGAVVAKTLAYEREQGGAPWNRSALLLVDNDDQGFEVVARRFADAVHGRYAPEIVTVTGDGSLARDRLLRAFGEGVGLLVYFGHGSMTLWAQEKIFSREDVPRLGNRDRLPIVLTVTCLSGLFNHPTAVSLGEALLRAEDGGAVAALVPSSAGGIPEQRFLSDALAQSLAELQDPTNGSSAALGEAVRSAQAKLPKGSARAQEMGLTFNLLGDPSLTIGR